MSVDYPFTFDSRGRTAETDEDEHVRDLIEQVLFTTPGERVNRPTFGSGVLQLLFAPNSQALAAATQLTVQGALQLWLGDRIVVDAVDVQSDDSRLQVLVQYTVRRNQQRRVAQFVRDGIGG
ncbi:MAG: GPW/gp25 family protein [Vicinamibacterales bacterium]